MGTYFAGLGNSLWSTLTRCGSSTNALRPGMIAWTPLHDNHNSYRVQRDDSLSDGQYLYHMLPWCYARKIFERYQLRLSRIDSWDDPYERWWHKRLFGDEYVSETIHAYGVCWTTRTFDEPLWRLAAFRQNDPILRIRCSVRALLRAALDLKEVKTGTVYLGRVRYRRQKHLIACAERLQEEPWRTEQAIANLLFHKRNAFRFENEVRLLWLGGGWDQTSLSLDIQSKSAITQVMISPYTKVDTCNRIRAVLNKWDIPCVQSGILKGV